MDNQLLWKIINSHFEDNPQSLVRHHIDSYNDFFKTGIFQIFKEKNPISINSAYDETIQDFRHQCILHFGGKNGDKIYFGKPVIYDKENPHYMFPNEARLRNFNYAMTVHYDIEVEFIDILEPGQAPYYIDAEMMGGDRYTATELDGGADYSEEIEEANASSGGNFKERSLAEFNEEEREYLDKQVEGGAPQAKKVERKKRVKSVEVEMTTAMAAQLREAQAETTKGKNIQKRTMTLEKIFLGKFPIMVQSEFCILNGLPREVKYSMGECRNDPGGYFIIDGKEKTVICQEKFGDNMLYIKEIKDDKYLYSAEIRSVSENVSKPIRTLSVRIKSPSTKYTFENIVVNIPNVRNPVPLFIVFRALGIISDKSIIEMCLLDMEKYESMQDLFIPSVHDAGGVMTQQAALMYIGSLTKYGTITYALEILSDYFLPHVGELNFQQKAYYLGYIVFRLLSVYSGLEQPTDRDNFKYKRIELVGTLLYDLFREYYTLQQREIHLGFEKILYYKRAMYEDDLVNLIRHNYREVFKERIVELGFKKAFKGNWGATPHTKKVGIVQDLNRLSFNSMISHLRKTNLPLDATAKIVGPRVLHCSQWGFVDPIDTPDGANIGLHKTLAIATFVSRGYSRDQMIEWLREKLAMKPVEDCKPQLLSTMTKVLVNGYWAGVLDSPMEAMEKFKLYRRNALIPIHTSGCFDIKQNTIFIYTDAGRLCRPIFYVDSRGKASYENKEIMNAIKEDDFHWSDLTSGFNRKKIDNFENIQPKIYELPELYAGIDAETNPARLERFLQKNAIIDYIDSSESETAIIAINQEELEAQKSNKFTHLEIHESLIFGVMCNQIIFPENNPPTRNSFSCGQSKQAVSMYHTNHQVRMDKTAVILNNGEIPLVKSRYMEYINNEENPYGENAIVAIMCYTGYNVEDAILINEGALKRGLFNTTYYTMYESHEESSKNASSLVDKHFTNIESEANIVGTKPGYDYSQLDKYGIIRENTEVNDKTVLIGLATNSVERKGVLVDSSKTPKKGQLGIVDKTFITEGEQGERIAKVRIREIRIPNLGDKMASRAGQKGTIGLVIPECDMPFTKDGMRPDLIINPHAIPSRMTIGQLVETVIGKACLGFGAFGDCTAFNNKGSKIGVFGEQLTRMGFHSSGNEILYNGMTGEQIQSDIFIGPNYYMRLKHMVKDKINYRARGPNTALTKQPVSGRANDGGLRIGEMERDVLLSHGINNFLQESMLDRGDKYYIAVCNQTGMLAIYNPSKNLFMSPMADGPIQYIQSIDGKEMNVENITKFGRSFSILCVPYSFKLLLQELQTINVQMRIITDDNIEQIENMMFSKNINKLTQTKDVKIPDIIEAMYKKLKQRPARINVPLSMHTPTPQSVEERKEDETYWAVPPEEWTPEESKKASPESVWAIPPEQWTPEEQTPGSVEYAPYSPAYMPSEGAENSIMSNASPEFRVETPQQTAGARREYQQNEPVLYRGDLKSNRIWTIRNIGPEFITIETDDVEGFDDISDTVKVVQRSDIYSPSEVVNAKPFMTPHQMPYGHMMMPSSNMGEQPNISISPVIKIVNGPDNSIDTSSGNGNGNETPATNAAGMRGGNILVDSIPPTINKPSSNMAETQKEPKEKSESSDGGFGGLFDFSKLLIKKMP